MEINISLILNVWKSKLSNAKNKEPVVSHDKPGAADHSSVDWDVLFDPTQSSAGPSPGYYILLVLVFNLEQNNLRVKESYSVFSPSQSQ